MGAAGPDKLRVTVIYSFIAHYRLGVFHEMMKDSSVEYSFVTGSRPPTPDIPLAPRSAVRPLTVVRNIWFGHVLVQPYVIAYALTSRADATILLGDVRYTSTWIGALVLRLRRRRVYFWTIGWHRPESGPKRLMRLMFYRLADGLLLYGEVGQSIGVAMGYPRDRIHVIGNSHGSLHPAVDGSLDPPATPARRGEAFDCPLVIGAVVRPEPSKRLDLLVHAVHRLREAGRDIGVVVVGEGTCRQALQDLASDLGVPITLPGAVYSEVELHAVYDRLLVTVVPEAIGLTAIQSLSHGRPVITCDDIYRQMPEHEAVRPGITGDLYRTGDVDDLARTIDVWLTRVGNDGAGVRRACQDEVAENWTSVAHARRLSAVMVASVRGRRRIVRSEECEGERPG